jgi:predicted AlkP superfamily pyrophosphatase or phosphodiesterase
MIMGAGPTLHGYTEWNSAVPEIPSSDLTKEGMFPSIFSILKEQKPSFDNSIDIQLAGIDPLVQKGTTDIRIPAKDNDDFCTESAEVIKTKKPTLTFVHLDQPDGVGHNIGHRTPAYYEELKKVDARIGKLYRLLKMQVLPTKLLL